MKPVHVSFLLFDGFSNMVLACLQEPLRAVRDQGHADVTWQIATMDGASAVSSSGLQIAPDCAVAGLGAADLVVIVSGFGFREQATRSTLYSVQHLARGATHLMAADTAPWLLAAAGMLDGRKATLHWQVAADFAETYPNVTLVADRHVSDGRFSTCGGASSALDLMLAYLSDRFGAVSAFDASTLFVHDTARQGAPMRGPDRLRGRGSDGLRRVLHHMSATIETPVALGALADAAGLSLRTMDRLFQRELSIAPGKYYQMLRLARARELAERGDLDLTEIAVRCGYAGAPALAKAYRARHGHSLFSSNARRGQRPVF